MENGSWWNKALLIFALGIGGAAVVNTLLGRPAEGQQAQPKAEEKERKKCTCCKCGSDFCGCGMKPAPKGNDPAPPPPLPKKNGGKEEVN